MLFAFVLAVTACSSSASDTNEPAAPKATSCRVADAPTACWQQRRPLGSGGWPPASGNTPEWQPGKFPLGMDPYEAFDKAWMFGQSYAYSSSDGTTWAQHDKTNWGDRIYQQIVFFKGALWMSGGLDYQSRTFRNDIWRSPDGITWNNVGRAAWSPRGDAALAAFGDRLWLFGGANHVKDDRSKDGYLNDVWVSNDGVQWTQVTGAAPWSPRDKPRVLVFGDALVLAGAHGKADVWRSADGREWKELTDQAPWNPRHDYTALVFDDAIWIFGGWAGTSANALNDVWFSRDATTWTRQAEHASWAPRGPKSFAFRDSVWIYSGKHTAADDNWGGDLWQMTRTAPTTGG
jgi:hypothetical protein